MYAHSLATPDNHNYILTTVDFLGVGGGDGNFALYFDSDLAYGSSEECLTFASPRLASCSPFIIKNCALIVLEY